MDTPSLFVYGTLAPGQRNEHIVEPYGGIWRRGTVKGKVETIERGAARGYLGITLDDDADPVRGWMLTSDALADHWQELDDFEGEGYDRVTTAVTLADGEMVPAWIYAWSGK